MLKICPQSPPTKKNCLPLPHAIQMQRKANGIQVMHKILGQIGQVSQFISSKFHLQLFIQKCYKQLSKIKMGKKS
jgi:hypothetical protein